MNLLENIKSAGGGLLDFVNGLPGALSPSMGDPAGDPSLASAADPAAVAAARERYRRAYAASMMQAAQSGTPFGALDATAATAAQPTYDNDISRAVQAAQYLKTQREQAKRTDALQQLISNVTDPKQRAALSVATPDQAAEQMLKEAYAKPPNAGERFSMTAMGNGLALVLDRQTGQTHLVRDPNAGTAAGVDPTVVDMGADEYMIDPKALGRYAPYGKAGMPMREAIVKRTDEKLKELGLQHSDLFAMRTNATAQAKSIGQMQGQLNQISSFENMARFNGERLLQLVDKIDETGVPAIEGYSRAFKRKGGDVDPAEFASVLTQFQTEAARILNTPDGRGIVSDSARHELMDVAPNNMTAAQAKRIINRLFLEMDMRRKYIGEQMQGAYSTMSPNTYAPGAVGVPQPRAPSFTQPGGAASAPGGLDTVPKPYTFPTLPRQ